MEFKVKKKKKIVLSSKFEDETLQENMKDLKNEEIVWYLVKSNAGAWIAGSVEE